MSGHSKWSSIKHKKAAVDAKRGKIFTKLIREITVAAKMGGGDMEANPRLRLAVGVARGKNMPKDTIDRAIKKGAGGNDGVDFEEVIYEGYGPHNVAVVVEALTDNRNRTASSIRHVFTKHNGNLGATNSVQYMFDRKGTFTLSKDAGDEDTITEWVLESGADDLEDDGDTWFVTCALENFDSVKTYLEEKGLDISEAELQRLPQTKVNLTDKEQAQKVLGFLELLEEDDDVQKVFANFEIDENLLAELE
ncbi:MAG: YebC/PmpR family DNA-binding transcriptional regulator [Deltaproteobacteria bacterium]|nr:YebC/PmpR family DNA-binding transcriptional regulator [Deltaproteobacteria bacterium]